MKLEGLIVAAVGGFDGAYVREWMHNEKTNTLVIHRTCEEAEKELDGLLHSFAKNCCVMRIEVIVGP